MASLSMHNCHPSMANDGCDPLLAACLGRILLNTGEENGVVCEDGWEYGQAREGVGKKAV